MLLLVALAFSPSTTNAYDSDPLQDTCVADLKSKLSVNGYPCKTSPPSAADFVFKGLATPASTNNANGLGAVFGVVQAFPALNTLGLSIARLDFAKGGLVPPHTHPRASELFHVLEGTIYAGFITTDNKLYAATVNKGEVMAFPKGLIHFQVNAGNSTALAFASLSSQSPGFQLVANALLGSGIPDGVLSKTLFVGTNVVDKLKAPFVPKK
ncbi:hypothetical protein SELMODRAFT_118954 [Selaginella moellendorffii]|uniref:Germin-like protein n=2 Tax=Selaginella moellendorffii TaxID=88036 RepID=D8SK09_SELML|nr:hypothetical protein SELMODRAFT_118954 [Selaginella moellendorffii]